MIYQEQKVTEDSGRAMKITSMMPVSQVLAEHIGIGIL